MKNNIITTTYKEKGSIFFAYIKSIKSIEEFEELKKLAYDSHKKIKHVLYVARFTSVNGENVSAVSNDREPIKVANEILLVLEKNNINNVAVCIARHYGGTPLGAGNLFRAYFNVFMDAYQKYINELI